MHPAAWTLDRTHPLVAPGDQIGERYVAVRPLGQGGMGCVWEVEHCGLGTRCALKWTKDGQRRIDARFRREARIAASIDHPHVVDVFDYDIDPVIGPYLVMELLSGPSLADVMMVGQPMSLRETVAWLEPTAQGLDAIHAHGLVHRDVKPENIVRADRGEDAPIKLVDLGLAVHVDGRDRITHQGVIVGTPHYLAPEVTEGAPATPASDIYSLAVVAYELLTGTVPHDGESALAICCNKLSTPAPSLVERSGRIFALPIEELFAEALSADPAERPRAASDLARRLAGCLRR